jgi:Sec-independent protein translocase protein TatA
MSGWAIGFGIGALVVVVVVALLLLLIVWARKIGTAAGEILAALHAARDHTEALWRIGDTNLAARRITTAAARSRESLARRGGS